jgi:hypothetical protein
MGQREGPVDFSIKGAINLTCFEDPRWMGFLLGFTSSALYTTGHRGHTKEDIVSDQVVLATPHQHKFAHCPYSHLALIPLSHPEFRHPAFFCACVSPVAYLRSLRAYFA